MKIPELEKLKEANAYLRNIKKRRQELYEKVGLCDGATSDVLHYAELAESKNRAECRRTISLMEEIRRGRRAAKDEKEILENVVMPFLNEHPALLDEISALLGRIERMANEQEARVYTPRVLDLDIAGKHFDTAIKETAKEIDLKAWRLCRKKPA